MNAIEQLLSDACDGIERRLADEPDTVTHIAKALADDQEPNIFRLLNVLGDGSGMVLIRFQKTPA